MTFILVSGKSGVGKTAVCNRLHGMLDQNGTFTMRYERSSKVACPEDHIRLYEKDKKHIVVSSASDGDKCMLEFAKYLDSLAKKPDIIVTTIREKDDIKEEEYPMSRMFALLDAIADGTTNLENYYNQKIAGKNRLNLRRSPQVSCTMHSCCIWKNRMLAAWTTRIRHLHNTVMAKRRPQSKCSTSRSRDCSVCRSAMRCLTSFPAENSQSL